MNRFYSLILAAALLVAISPMNAKKAFADATVNITATVNQGLAITNGSDTANPTIASSISVTPAVGASDASDTQVIRVRSNKSTWTLTAYQGTAFDGGTTGVAATDVKVMITAAGSQGSATNASAGTFSATFSGTTGTLNDISTMAGSPTTIVTGAAKTSSSRDSSANANNYFAISNVYSIAQDFFFAPGTATAQIVYVLSAT